MSNLHNAETIQRYDNDCLDLDCDSPCGNGGFDEYKDKVRILFDKVLSVFSREVFFQPIPSYLGDGQIVDLFKLLWVMRKKGGYDAVSSSDMWGSVAVECGLTLRSMASVRLTYVKYLKELDQWLRLISKDRSLENGDQNHKCDKNSELLLSELERELKCLLKKVDMYKYDKFVKLRPKVDGNATDVISDKSDRNLLVPKVIDGHGNAKSVVNDNVEKNSIHFDNSVAVSAIHLVGGLFNSRKRTYECSAFSGMVNWVIQIAKHPDDPSIGVLPDCSKRKEHGNGEFWAQALLARDALLVSNCEKLSVEKSHAQKKLKMHPSLYEDNNALNHHSTERLRCSKRIIYLTKSRFCSCCKTRSAKHDKMPSSYNEEMENGPKVAATEEVENMPKDDPIEKEVSVGPLFQAEVPEWTGKAIGSESKWLGTRMWPPKDEEMKVSIKLDPIGIGRPNACDCLVPGSVECVRFHIAEKRMKLKLELGLLFYHWRFNRMGEEVSLSWTEAEEKRFKDIMNSNSESWIKSWRNPGFSSPTKTREKLVGYYFNVFLIQRRSYQNRITPKDVDTDDETDFESIGGSFGSAVMSVNQPLLCVENKQCTELP